MSKKTAFILILLIFTGTFLRLFKFTNTLLLESDQAMAFLLAERIINYDHILLVGPNTSFHAVNLLSPLYYYLVTVIYFFFRSELGVSLVFAFFGIISISLIYLLARELKLSSKAALLSAFFYTFSFTLIKYSRNIWEPHLVPFFVMLTFYFAFKADRKSQFLLLLLSVFLFFISLMYISSFLILPAFFLLAYSILKKIDPAAIRPFLKNLFIFFLFASLFYFPNIFFEITNNFPSFPTVNDFPLAAESGYLFNLQKQLVSFINAFYPLQITFILPVVIFFLSLCFYLTSKYNKKINWLVLFLYSALLLITTYQGDAYPHRFTALYPLLFLILAFVATRLGKIIAFIFSLIFLFYNLNNYANYVFQDNSGEIKVSKEIADFILSDSNGQSFSIYTDATDNHTNYNTVYYVYLMEKSAKKPLYPLHSYGNWIDSQLNKNARWIYLICEDFYELQIENRCLNKFISGNPFLSPMESFPFSENREVFKFRNLN